MSQQEQLSHFVERSGIVECKTPWGRWWQTVHEVHLEVNLPEGTKAKEVSVNVKPNYISCKIRGKDIFTGNLFGTVHADETVWTIEDGKVLTIVLAKANHSLKEEIWESLLENHGFQPDMLTLHEMRKKFDLEKFQIENPGFDFSRAKLQKCYDQLPGWSSEALKKNDEKTESQDS
ncbi:nudC domain-containing protein 2 [Anabrus simplex]|uniref:nudC domain-containing protein 2 n=1 Tax=Anabrus simplex TaxID=316456 RepID=UPI0034DDA035